jgi:diguanylate cyclase (GGDEF)-like protein/PAS domain S-box-containing protein
VTYKRKPRAQSQPTSHEALTRTLAALAAHRHDGILRAVAMSARDLLRASDLQQSLSNVIERIGKATGVDRAHIFEIDATTPEGRIVHHHMWSAPEAPVLPLQARATGTSMAQVGLGAWVPRLASGEVIVGDIVQFEEPVRRLFERLGTQSVLVVPIFVDGNWWGDIGLDDCHSRRDWSSPEIDTVKTLAELVGAAVARTCYITDLADANRIIENSPTILYRLSPQEPYRLIFVSQNVRRYGFEADELLASPVRWLQHVRSDYHPAIAADIKSIIDRKVDYTLREFLLTKPNGSQVWFEGRGYPLRDDDGQLVAIEGILTDITERKQSEDALRESEEKFRSIFGSVNDGIFISDPSTGKFVDINPPGCSMFGFAHDELVGRDIVTISSDLPPYTQSAIMELLEKVRTSGPQRFEWHCKAKDGHLFWAEVSVRCAAFGGSDFVLATLRDISDRKQIEANILQMARYDGLTSLANRHTFVEAIQYEIASARRGERGFAVLYLDLDHFKDINDTLGHPMGDLLLKAVAERLQANVRKSDMVARFGGDEFAVIIVGLTEPEEAALLSSQLLKALSDPFSIQGNEIRSGTSIGIALYGPDSADAETLLAHADVALYRAKSEGRGGYRFFTDAMDAEVRTRVVLDAELREAIAAHQLLLLYQPQVEIESGNIAGLEALVRWRHPPICRHRDWSSS